MVVAAASMVIAALAVVVALLGEPGTDPADTVALEQARDGAAAAQSEAGAATDMADAAVVLAEEAAAKASLLEDAVAEAFTEAEGAVDPDVVAELQAQLVEVRNLAAEALVAAGEAAGAEEAAAEETTSEDDAAAEDSSEAEEAPAPDAEAEDPSEPDDGAAVEEPGPEPNDEAAVEDDSVAAADLPGEAFELAPAAGTGLSVVGVRHDSALNLRDIPGGAVVARLDNVMDGVREPAVYVRQPDSDDINDTVDLHSGIVATGNSRQLPTTIWHELQVGSLRGWASATYLAQVGGTDDATSEVVDTLGELPVADTMVELGIAVAQTMASQEPRSSVVVSGAPGLAGDLGQVTIDIVGIGDDSVRGFRLVVFAHPAENWTPEDPGPFTLKSVERTVLCHSNRGVSEEGLCN